MDTGYRFETLINKLIKRPIYVTYAEYWDNENERISLLFTACLVLYDKKSYGKDGERLQKLMKELFKDRSKKKGIECLNFLSSIIAVDTQTKSTL